MDSTDRFRENLVKSATIKDKAVAQKSSATSEPPKGEPLVGQIASAYEKIRGILDYREAASLRRYAIERFLIRSFRPDGHRELGARLLKELTLAEYISSDQATQDKADRITEIIKRAQGLYHNLARITSAQEKYGILRQVAAIASAEIERLIGGHESDYVVLARFQSQIWGELEPILPAESANRHVLKNRLLIAEAKTLLEADSPMLQLLLLQEFIPGWSELDSATIKTHPELKTVIHTIDAYLADPETNRLANLIQPISPPYSVLIDLSRSDASELEKLYKQETLLAESARQIINHKNQHLAQNLARSVVRSIGYLLLTKSILAIILEIPYDAAISGQIHYLPLIVNLLFPPLLLLGLTSPVQIAGSGNTAKIISILKKILFEPEIRLLSDETKEQLVEPPRHKPATTLALTASIGIALGVVLLILYLINFSWVSMLLFVLFISLVSFLAYRITQNARRLSMIPQREKWWQILVDFFSLPFLQMGKWLTEKLAKANVFLLLIDLLIEAPLKKLLEFLEIWIRFVRQKKQEIG